MSFLHEQTRRQFFDTCGIGLGKIALASLFAGGTNRVFASGGTPFEPQPTHFAPRAKRVIYLFMAGAPSQLELFDYKPKLTELSGKPIPPSVIAGQRYAFIQPDAAVLAPQFPFAKHGKSGAELSDRLPHLAKVADELTIVKSVHTDQFNHSPAQIFVNTGSPIPGRPSMGSWLSYGIGSDSQDLPSFVVLRSGGTVSGGAAMWGSGFLPTSHAGVPFRAQGDPILHIANPKGYDDRAQRESLDLIRKLNERQLGRVGDPEIRTRINAYEMAWRMQSAAPELMDFSDETEETRELYGCEPGNSKKSFANNCLLARRLVERGVRFVQLYDGGWDHHSQVAGGVTAKAKDVDQGCAGLIMDLKQRGLLDDTLVIFGGEFGRTPMVEASAALGRSQGRDHHPQAFTMWFAGGGMKPGITYGATDELGFNVVENPVHVHDVQATILHQLGINHEHLTFRFQGRDFRLTDVHGHVVKDILA
ncbi:sulfatase [Haloferula helveola]|uniref:Sulfatase n=1 Tax=Haloferula helveola TaxID=490095 RepID=A0ABM7R6R9_9BACT|nr:sulfatase [Haloferula helveola]